MKVRILKRNGSLGREHEQEKGGGTAVSQLKQKIVIGFSVYTFGGVGLGGEAVSAMDCRSVLSSIV